MRDTTTPDKIHEPDTNRLPRLAETEEQLVAEVEADLQALEVYLLDAVFDAAGFRSFREQELGRIRDRFSVDWRDDWMGVALNEYYNHNPKLLQRLPADLCIEGFDTEVSDRLRQLRIALENAARLL